MGLQTLRISILVVNFSLPCMTADDLKKLNKDAKLIKGLCKRYNAFLASESLIKFVFFPVKIIF